MKKIDLIKKHLVGNPTNNIFYEEIMRAPCIQFNLPFSDTVVSKFEFDNFKLHQRIVLIEDKTSVNCFVDRVENQIGFDNERYFFEAYADDQILRILFGIILKVEAVSNSQYYAIVKIESYYEISNGDVIRSADLSNEILGDGLNGRIVRNTVQGLWQILTFYKWIQEN